MLRIAVAVILAAWPLEAVAQRGPEETPPPFSIADIMSAPFASGLVPAPDGRAVAWIGNEEGRRNVWIAEAPTWRARRLTAYRTDEGQDISSLTWTANSLWLLYVRGGNPGGNWSTDVPTNALSDPAGTEQAIWRVSRRGGAPRRIAAGHSPVPSPRSDVVVFTLRDTVYTVPLLRAARPEVLLNLRGTSVRVTWAPDGRSLAFVSRRGDHSFIGIYGFARRDVRWVDPGTWRDDFPRWSADGVRIAFIRRSGQTFPAGAPLPPARGDGQPQFTIRVADVATLESREVWRSPSGPEGALPGLAGEWALQWTGDRLVFSTEMTGWLGLYSVPDTGGAAVRLTPSGCEFQDMRFAADRTAVYYASNCGDIDRRHVQRVAVGGGAPETVTSGSGIEWNPAPLAGGAVAVLRSDARRPASPALVDSAGALPALDGWPQPESFPLEQMVEPRQVIVTARDSMRIHLQVFLPDSLGPGRHPAVIFVHGGPVRQMLLGWHHRGYYHHSYAFNQYLASRGYVVVSVNFRGGDGYGRAFREAPGRGRFGASEYQDVLAAAEWLRRRSDVDTTRIGLWGGSYGGYLTALGLARNSDLFAAGVDVHGVHDYAISRTPGFALSDTALAVARRSSPVADVARWRSPVLLISGDDDRNVEFQQTTDLAVRLRRAGVRVEELVFPDEVHSFLRHANWLGAFRAAAQFFATTLGTAVR